MSDRYIIVRDLKRHCTQGPDCECGAAIGCDCGATDKCCCPGSITAGMFTPDELESEDNRPPGKMAS